jgi:hypothetical protein
MFCIGAESRQLGPVSQNLQRKLLVSSFLQSTKIQRKYFNQQFCNAAKTLDSGGREYSSWWVHWACRASTKDFCRALAALVGPAQNNFFLLTIHYFTSFVPIAQQAGQAVVPRRLYLNMRL